MLKTPWMLGCFRKSDLWKFPDDIWHLFSSRGAVSMRAKISTVKCFSFNMENIFFVKIVCFIYAVLYFDALSYLILAHTSSSFGKFIQYFYKNIKSS